MTKVNGKMLVLVALVVLLVAGAAGAGYAYWAGSVTAPTTSGDDEVTITVGTGQAVATTLTLSGGTGAEILVPEDRADTGQVEFVVREFTVTWTETAGDSTAVGTTGVLAAVVDEDTIMIGDDDTYASLVNIAIQVGGTKPTTATAGSDVPAISLDGSSVKVFVIVTLEEPDTKAIYDVVAGKDITFDILFSVGTIA